MSSLLVAATFQTRARRIHRLKKAFSFSICVPFVYFDLEFSTDSKHRDFLALSLPLGNLLHEQAFFIH